MIFYTDASIIRTDPSVADTCVLNNFGQNRVVLQEGNDVDNQGNINQEDCKKLCNQNTGCKSVAFCPDSKTCWLKDKTLTGYEETRHSTCTTYFKQCRNQFETVAEGSKVACSANSTYTAQHNIQGCDGWQSVTLDDCKQKCLDNEIPAGCSNTNNDVCKYVVWDDNRHHGGWCQLANENCELVEAIDSDVTILKVNGPNVQCPSMNTASLGTFRCSGKSGHDVNDQWWELDGWGDGEQCRQKCLEVIKETGSEGCCEARPRNSDFSYNYPHINTYCFFRANAGLVSGWSDTKAIACEDTAKNLV